MIIDIHAHLAYAPIYPERFLADMFRGLTEKEKNQLNTLFPVFLKDKEGTILLKQMDIAGIDRTVLLIIDGGVALGEAELGMEENYAIHYNLVKNYPDRFSVLAGIDPRRKKTGYDLFRKGIETYGFKGLKLYPPMGFGMDNEALLPYFEYCECHKLPVVIHTGPSHKNLENDFSNPLLIKPVAQKYPGINFILAHAGFSLNNDLAKLIENTDNIYVDISGGQIKYPEINDQLLNHLSPLFCNEKINCKVLFGTDWPQFHFIQPICRQALQIKELANAVNGHGATTLDNILGRNAERIL